MVPFVAVVLAGVLGGGCSSEGSDRIGVLRVQVAGERELVLGIDACHANAKATVIASSAEHVVVRVNGSRSNRDSCADGLTLCLDDDLSGRAILDDTSGQLFTPMPAGPATGGCGN